MEKRCLCPGDAHKKRTGSLCIPVLPFPCFYSVLSLPQKNSATVPGPVWLPMVVPT